MLLVLVRDGLVSKLRPGESLRAAAMVHRRSDADQVSGSIATSPVRSARIAAWVRSATPSLVSTLLT